MGHYRMPKQARSQKTFDDLLDAAGHLLCDVGIEQISANLVCERAKVTPPAFYRYFDDKYGIFAALSDRLMAAQNEVLLTWLERHQQQGLAAMSENLIELIGELSKVTASQPGALWVMRALHAVPSLTNIRLDSHNQVTDLMTDIYVQYLPHVPRALIRRRTRLSVELCYSITELLEEEDMDMEGVLADSAHIFNAMFNYPEYQSV